MVVARQSNFRWAAQDYGRHKSYFQTCGDITFTAQWGLSRDWQLLGFCGYKFGIKNTQGPINLSNKNKNKNLRLQIQEIVIILILHKEIPEYEFFSQFLYNFKMFFLCIFGFLYNRNLFLYSKQRYGLLFLCNAI